MDDGGGRRGTRARRGRHGDDQARREGQGASGSAVEGGGDERNHQVSPEEGIDAAAVTDRSGGRLARRRKLKDSCVDSFGRTNKEGAAELSGKVEGVGVVYGDGEDDVAAALGRCSTRNSLS